MTIIWSLQWKPARKVLAKSSCSTSTARSFHYVLPPLNTFTMLCNVPSLKMKQNCEGQWTRCEGLCRFRCSGNNNVSGIFFKFLQGPYLKEFYSYCSGIFFKFLLEPYLKEFYFYCFLILHCPLKGPQFGT